MHRATLDGRSLEVYERSALVMVGPVPVPTVVETFYVWAAPTDWPKTRIRARRGLGRLLYRWGRRPGLELDEPAFNEAFRVDAADEDFAIAVLSPELQAFLLEKRTVDWSLGEGALKLFYRGRLRRSRMEASLERLHGFWARLPVEVRGQVPGSPNASA